MSDTQEDVLRIDPEGWTVDSLAAEMKANPTLGAEILLATAARLAAYEALGSVEYLQSLIAQSANQPATPPREEG